MKQKNTNFTSRQMYLLMISGRLLFTIFQTASLLQTDQQFPTIGSQTKGFKQNKDGFFDLFFSPNAPVGVKNN